MKSRSLSPCYYTMGVLSADLRDGQAVTILAEGPDEAQAVCTLSKLLGA